MYASARPKEARSRFASGYYILTNYVDSWRLLATSLPYPCAPPETLLSMTTSEPIVYLEDVDVGEKRRRTTDVIEETSGERKPAINPVKRQRTLEEVTFFSGSQGRKVMSTSSARGSVKPDAGAWGRASSATAGVPKLNAIPFSMTAYVESLDENERRLLQIEYRGMGKSW